MPKSLRNQEEMKKNYKSIGAILLVHFSLVEVEKVFEQNAPILFFSPKTEKCVSKKKAHTL
jgi:hypothetical protein